MRLTILALAFVLFFAALASADAPELADEALVLRWQRDIARMNAARLALELSTAALVARHNLGPGDEIPDPETRVIKRAPRPAPKSPAPPAK